ncbi:MAG: PAS domain S-box protein [Bacteroidota bacterium]|nr:PAS domain S-box protein [Bacteroidota bacterium]MDP4192935.1 PAS domain S-box protein [Bacteroidota bacterium]MDP4195616.1 PAS domain S-box protein [Bacteroidota bacterium]
MKRSNSSFLNEFAKKRINNYYLNITLCNYEDISLTFTTQNHYDICFYFVETQCFDLTSIEQLRKDISSPLIIILQEENYELSYLLIRAGADDCIIKKDISIEVLSKLLDKFCTRANNISREEISKRISKVETISSFFNNVKIGFAAFDLSGKMIECNDSLQNMFGFGKKEILNIKLSDICRTSQATEDITYEKINSREEKYLEIEKPFFNIKGELIFCHILIILGKGSKKEPGLILMIVSDITHKKITHQELEREKYYLQTLLDNIPDAIYFKDTEHRFIKVSKYIHLHGLKDPQEAIGRTDFDFFTDQHALEAYRDEEKIIQTGKTLINKIEKETFLEGGVAWVSTTKAPLFDHLGNVSGIVGISRDITEIKAKEEALAKSEERYRNLIEYSPDTIAIICKGRLVFINNAGLALMKASGKNDLIDKDIQEFVDLSYIEPAIHFFEQISENKKPIKALKVKLKKLDREMIETEITGLPTIYNNLPATQVIIRDVTEVKKQERIQKTTLKLLKASNYANTADELFRYIHQAVSELMPVKNFYIALYDENSKLLSFPYCIDEEDEQMPPQSLGKGLTEYVLKTGKAHLVTEQMDIELREKGEVELVGAPAKIWLGVPLQVREKTIGVMAVQDYYNEKAYSKSDKQALELLSFSVSRSIERKMAEEEILKYVQQLKETNATKDRFFSFISHDLRSPFSSLLGFSELLIADYDDLSDQEVKRYLEIIGATSRNLYNLLNNLLQFTRFQTGRVQYCPKYVSLLELIERNVELIKGNIIKKELKLTNNIKEEIDLYIDEEMISSVIQNLLTNAIKFTPRKGEIKLSSKLDKGKNEVEISVSDTGIGMDEQTISKLFRIEVIQTTSGTEKESGTGLGLLLTKEAVEKNNGKIYVESIPKEGTTFRFTLPLKPSLSFEINK